MKQQKKPILLIILQVLFWGIVAYFFCNYSFLRPFAVQDIYKEPVSLGFIILMVYANWFLLIPLFFKRNRFAMYWLLAILSIFLAGMGEFFLVKPNIISCYSRTMDNDLMNRFLRIAFFMITIRDFCFFIFFFLTRLYLDISKTYLLEKQTVSEKCQTVTVLLSSKEARIVEISKISYLSHDQNYTTFHLVSGEELKQYISLREMEEVLPKGTFIRINKSCIVIFSQILDYNEYSVTLKPIYGKANKVLPIYLKGREEVLSILKKYMQETSENNLKKAGEKSKNGGIYDEITPVLAEENEKTELILEENSVEKEIYDYILAHPSCKSFDILEAINIASKRSIERSIQELKKMSFIEHRGSNKTGGYFAIEKKSED